MEGFERDWTDVGQRRIAYYANIPHGDYRFHVMTHYSDTATRRERAGRLPSD